MKISQIVVLLLLLNLTGCATLFNNNPQPIKINTPGNKPANAKISAPGVKPYKITIPDVIFSHASSFTPLKITVDDPCYLAKTVRVDTSLEPIFWANIFNAFYGMPLDYLTGSMWSYSPQVNIPLVEGSTASEDCIDTNYKLSNFSSYEIPEPTLGKHRISMGWTSKTHSKRYKDSYKGTGVFFEYLYYLNREFMLSTRFQANSSNEYYYSDSINCRARCYTDIQTDQIAYTFAIRHYINTNSNFYAGLGVAQVYVDQTYYEDGMYVINDDYTVSAQASTIFLDLGWQPRNNRLSVQINAMIDFADLRLSSPSFNYDDEDLSSYDNKIRETEAINRFRNAGIISNINIGLAYQF